jgi:hypothetical protein
MKKIDMIELVSVVICLFFAIVISLYHVSYSGYLGLTESQWSIVWAISENGLGMTMSILISLFTIGILKLMFRWVFVPYFASKLIYYFSCYSGVYLLSKRTWGDIWSFVLVFLVAGGLGYCLFLIRKKYVDQGF